ncbi:hypothetical protein RCL_jg28151.t1 [Rhizophagus clarus]|uniref:SAM domain-containing protein n=1 Tax=Rhizophagus clarus TaxID=94130 RepID=A0A8H3LQ88_9GLOM|nr:hypothetical protein RCL_jg28151.t1 [Rhizophagus clarus]
MKSDRNISDNKKTTLAKSPPLSTILASFDEAFLEYGNNFIEHGYSVEELPYLNLNQLQSIGITKLGHYT